VRRKTRSFDSLVALWRDVSLFAAAFAYLAGWTYIRSYYLQLEIDPNLLDISFNNYFIYAFFALLTFSGIALIVAFFLSAGLVRRLGGGRVAQTMVLVAFAFGLFGVSRAQGAKDGRSLRARFQRLPAVQFTFKDPNLLARLTADPDWNGTLFLLTATKDKYAVLAQPAPDPIAPNELPAAATLLIPASEVIAHVRVQNAQK
jgi:hypothetical protein